VAEARENGSAAAGAVNDNKTRKVRIESLDLYRIVVSSGVAGSLA
jgi:hypothetical protein